MRCFFAFSLLLACAPVWAAEASLSFRLSGREIKRLSASEVSTLAPPKMISEEDPHYGKRKTFRCWPIAPLMRAVYGKDWQDGVHTRAALGALDGYVSQTDAAKLGEDGGCLAFEDLDVAGWEPVGRKQASPAPFYLFWTGEEQSTQNGYPWPWQLASIDLIRFEEAYPEVVPSGAPAGSAAMRGFTIFQNRCLRCHAINQQGGKIGPDLNAPQSIVQYRSKKWIKSWIRQPSKYRYTEMPDHLDLTDADLDDLYEYFRWKSKQPEKKW